MRSFVLFVAFLSCMFHIVKARPAPIPAKNPCKLGTFGMFKGVEIKSFVCASGGIPSTFLIKNGKVKGR